MMNVARNKQFKWLFAFGQCFCITSMNLSFNLLQLNIFSDIAHCKHCISMRHPNAVSLNCCIDERSLTCFDSYLWVFSKHRRKGIKHNILKTIILLRQRPILRTLMHHTSMISRLEEHEPKGSNL